MNVTHHGLAKIADKYYEEVKAIPELKGLEMNKKNYQRISTLWKKYNRHNDAYVIDGIDDVQIVESSAIDYYTNMRNNIILLSHLSYYYFMLLQDIEKNATQKELSDKFAETVMNKTKMKHEEYEEFVLSKQKEVSND